MNRRPLVFTAACCSLLETGNQSYPSPAAEPNDDGSTTVCFGPQQPVGVERGNWIQTLPGKGCFTIL